MRIGPGVIDFTPAAVRARRRAWPDNWLVYGEIGVSIGAAQLALRALAPLAEHSP